jgi:hypothetical protein
MNTTLRAATALTSLLGLAGASSVTAQELPSPQQIIERYVEASGGEKAIRSTQSMHATGRMEMPAMGMTAQVQVSTSAPDRLLMVMDLPNVGALRSGFDGTVGWMENPMTGPMLLEGDQLGDLMRQADFYVDLRYAELYPTMETVAKEEFAGQPAYKVRLVDSDGKETIEYFSVDSGLKLGFEGEQTSEMGTVYVTTELSDYKEVEGRTVPMTQTSKMMGMEMKMVLETVVFDQVDPSVYALPETIKTLVAGAKSGASGS